MYTMKKKSMVHLENFGLMEILYASNGGLEYTQKNHYK